MRPVSPSNPMMDPHLRSPLILVALILCGLPLRGSMTQQQDDDILFSDCDLDDYYAELLQSSNNSQQQEQQQPMSWWQDLVTKTHRRVLPYTDSDIEDDDVWKALIDLDPGAFDSTADSVQLIYSSTTVPALPHGTADTWNREHLWPQSRGPSDNAAASAFKTDVHHLRPADWNVNAVRSNRYFGDCTTTIAAVEETDTTTVVCVVPADEEAALDTARGFDTFLPPAEVRGDIARALFYVQLRYAANGLRLTDCPYYNNNDEGEEDIPETMAYRSVLLQWHLDDPVSVFERQRNQRVCERWQGNRNPFVDFPNLLVEKLIMDQSDELCDNNSTPTPQAPSATTTPAPAVPVAPNTTPTAPSSSCDDLQTGDVLFVAAFSDNPDVVALVALEQLDESLDLYLTDNAWTDEQFRENEGVVRLSLLNPIEAGTVFGYAPDSTFTDNDALLHSNDWVSESGSFALSADGDNVFLYCQQTDGSHFLAALSTASENWQYDESDSASTSDLPAALLQQQQFALALPHVDNYVYDTTTATTTGTKVELQRQLLDATNWVSSNENPEEQLTIPSAFTVTPANDINNGVDEDEQDSSISSTGQLNSGDVMVFAVHSDNPDLVALVALEDVPAGIQIHITDNSWNDATFSFRTNEGTLTLKVPQVGIAQGTVFGYGPPDEILYGDQWTSLTDAGFSLSAEGDTVLVYWTDDDKEDSERSSTSSIIHHLGALSFNGPWTTASVDTASSALPKELIEFSTTLSHADNVAYTGSMIGTKTTLQAALQDPSNWSSSNTDPLFFASSTNDSGGGRLPSSESSKIFEVQDDTTSAAATVLWPTALGGSSRIVVCGYVVIMLLGRLL